MFSPTSPKSNGSCNSVRSNNCNRARQSSQELVSSDWEDILAMMDHRSETLGSQETKSMASKVKLPTSKGSSNQCFNFGAPDVSKRRKKTNNTSNGFMSSTGLPPSAFAPVSDDEVSVADDYEGKSPKKRIKAPAFARMFEFYFIF